MEKNPEHNWGVIYQQGWTLLLKEKLDRPHNSGAFNFSNNHTKKRNSNGNRRDQTCWRFNKGKCSFGAGCRFEHKCGTCGKLDHGTNNCPKKKERNSTANQTAPRV